MTIDSGMAVNQALTTQASQIRQMETASPKVADVKGEEIASSQLQGDEFETGKAAEGAPKKWTIMVYSAADNNLNTYMVDDVNEMEKIGSTQFMNMIVQLDRGGSDCKRYVLQADPDMAKVNSPMIKDLGSTNMADPKVLADFIKESTEKFPAENYALIISDHGLAWEGVVSDDSHKGWMTTPNIRKGIEMSGKKIDLLGFDACLMATSEVAYELKDVAKYLVASEQSEGADGWPYTPILSEKMLQEFDKMLRSSRVNISADELAKKIVQMSAGSPKAIATMSAIDLSKMATLGVATDKFADSILQTDTPNSVFKAIMTKAENFYGYRDQFHFAEMVSKSPDVKDEKVKEAAKGMMAAIENAVIAEEHI